MDTDWARWRAEGKEHILSPDEKLLLEPDKFLFAEYFYIRAITTFKNYCK